MVTVIAVIVMGCLLCHPGALRPPTFQLGG